MIVATFNIHEGEPRIHAQVSRPARWLVQLYVTDGTRQDTQEIRNRQPCYLTDLLKTASETINAMLDDLPACTDAGFVVRRLR